MIPPFNAEALAVEDIYSVNDVIPEAEYKVIPISDLVAASTEGTGLLPYKRSSWVNQRFVSVFAAQKLNRKAL